MFQLQVLHLLIYIYIFDDGYKGDPQKALLKAASMRATLRSVRDVSVMLQTPRVKNK